MVQLDSFLAVIRGSVQTWQSHPEMYHKFARFYEGVVDGEGNRRRTALTRIQRFIAIFSSKICCILT